MACQNTSSNNSTSDSIPQQEFYANGYIAKRIINKTDSTVSHYFYSAYDSGKLDSLYRFRLFHDTMVPWQQYIYDRTAVKEELAIQRLTLDSGDFVSFKLLKPRYYWMAVYVIRPNLGDTILRVPDLAEYREYYLEIPPDSAIGGFVIDCGIWETSDSVGTIGLQVDRYLMFNLKAKLTNEVTNRRKLLTEMTGL